MILAERRGLQDSVGREAFVIILISRYEKCARSFLVTKNAHVHARTTVFFSQTCRENGRSLKA